MRSRLADTRHQRERGAVGADEELRSQLANRATDDVGGVLDAVTEVYCASCWEPMGTRPRSHGYPARQAAIALTEDGPWPARPAWEIGDHADAHDETTRAGALVVAHDLARGVLRRVTTWEWLTGITDEQRARIRAEHPDDPD